MIQIGTVRVKGGEELLFTAQDFSLEDSGVYLLLGPNGCGKTSFLKQLSRLMIERKIMARDAIGHISAMSTYDRSIPLNGERFYKLYEGACNWPEKFEKNFGHLRMKSIREMSSGEFQSLCLISQLCAKKKIYLFDEPFSHLNPIWAEVFVEHIEKASIDAAFFIICHHVDDFKNVNLKRLSVSNGQLVSS